MATNKYISQSNSPHIGEMLQARIKKRRISKAAVSRALQRAPETFYSFTKKHSLQTEILWQICTVMKHNFFADLAIQLPSEFTSNAPIDTSKDEIITKLSEENRVLKGKLELLERIINKNT